MYNNNPNNVWPPLAYQYGTQAVGQMALNGNVLPQNVNYVQQYYGQNQAYGLGQARPGQQYTHWFYEHMSHQHNPYGQTQVTPAITTAYLAHPSGQTVPIQTNKQTFHSQPSNPSAAGLMAANHSEKWMELLNPKDRQVLDQLNKEQHEFEQMFKNWENDFEDWQRKNRSHPDINAYNTYVSQWQQWRQKLVEKQKEMVTRTAQTLQQLKSQVQPLMSPTTASQPSRVPPPPPPQVPPPPPDPPKQPPPPPTPPKTNKNNSNSNSNDTQNSNSKKTTTIEVIEIDCEESVKMSKSQSKPESIPDPTLVSKAAEDMLFIQKQQELLKSLENLKSDKREQEMKNNTTGEDVQSVEPKPFDMNDIVNKMKAIKHPEDPTEANKILSDLPALQGIVFTPRSPSASNTHPNDYNRPFNNIRPDQRMPARRPFPGDHNSSRFQTPPYGPSIGNRPPFTHFSPSGPVNRWPAPRQPLRQQSPPVRRQYSAQTIDYNHRPETRDLSPNQKPLNSPSAYLPNQFSYDNNNHYNRYKPNPNSTETFDCSRKPPISLPVTKPMPEMRQMEEIFSYNDIRYFTQPKSRIVLIDDLLKPPTREFRPANIVIILRGLPGSGKTYFAKLIKEMEIEFGGSAPRILSIDDYFMAEVEREVKAPDTGKMVKTKEYAYEYEKEMESYYRASLLKTYKKTVDDRLFSFIIIDAVNELIADIEDFYSYAIKNDFVVYVIEMMSNDPSVCHKDNVHNRKLEDIKQIHSKWQTLPEFMLRLDIRSLLQKESIKEVEMESIDMSAKQSGESAKRKVEIEDQSPNKHSKLSFDPYEEEEAVEGETRLSRWERMEASDSKLDKLDSFRMKSKPTIEEYLQVTDDYELRNRDQQKRVRWADIEEQEKQQRIRERGFEVGLNWQQYMDPQHPHRLLTETKYF